MKKSSLWAVGGQTCPRLGRVDNFDGQSVQALIDEILQRIIHKAMPLNPWQTGELRAANAHPEMRAMTQAVGAGMPRMVGTFVDHFQAEGLQMFGQARVQLRGLRHHGLDSGGTSGFSPLSMKRPKYMAWASTKTSIKPMPPNSLKFTQVSVSKW